MLIYKRAHLILTIRPLRALMHILVAIVIIYVLLALALYLLQSSLIYFPSKDIVTTPHDIGLRYEAIFLTTEDGVEISGWFVPCDNPRGVVLFCHGNAGNISHRLQTILILHRLNLSTFIFDYRGYGSSEGSPSERGTYLDAQAAWGYLVEKRRIPPHKIIVFGRSLGGAIAAWLVGEAKKEPGALIVESAFTSVPDLAAKLYPVFPARPLVRFRYDTRDFISRASCPVMVIHSCDDEIVPYNQGCDLFESASEPKEFLEIRGDHNMGFVLTGESYIRDLDKFITKSLNARKRSRPRSLRGH